MFGTIGHSRIKPGHEAQMRALNEEWDRELRPTIPGVVWALWGTPTGRGNEIVNVIAVQDEATYRALAENPAQDAWYRRLVEHLDGEPTWEDVAWEGAQVNAGRAG